LNSVETIQTYIGTIANCLKININNGEEKGTIWIASKMGIIKGAEVGSSSQTFKLYKRQQDLLSNPMRLVAPST
jgi:hypothetical protein